MPIKKETIPSDKKSGCFLHFLSQIEIDNDYMPHYHLCIYCIYMRR